MARILLIEDDEDFRKLLSLYLREADHECAECGRGDTALEFARAEVAKNGPFDLIILDGYYLPGKLGPEVCRELRAEPAFSQVSILVISVERPEVLQQTLDGMKIDRFMRKPLFFQDVINEVQALMSKRKEARNVHA